MANPPADGYIGRYGPAAPGWIAQVIGTGEDKILASAPGPGSTIYGGGWYEASPTFNGNKLATAGGRDIFLARFNTFTGAVNLTRRYGGTADDEMSSAASKGGELVAAGRFGDPVGAAQGTLAFGGTAQPLTSNGGLDIWVAKLDVNGDGVWAVHYGGTGDERDPRIAIDAAGDVYVTGTFSGQVAFGAVNLVSMGDADIFIAKLRGTNGSVAWAVSLGGPSTDRANDITVDDAGHVVIAASLNGTASATGDALIECFDAGNGASRWRKPISTTGSDGSSAVTFGRTGDLYAVVNLGGPFDFGVPLIGAAGPAAVVLRIAP